MLYNKTLHPSAAQPLRVSSPLGTKNHALKFIMVKIKQSSFFPVSSLDGKNNFKRFYRIDRDGVIVERVFLDVSDPSSRELLICLHYLRHLVRNFLSENVGINIVDRDNPWDFLLELSTGEPFYLEITSIADNPKHFEINKSEERLSKWDSETKIPLRELKKLNHLFPDPKASKAINSYRVAGVSNSNLVDNPLIKTGPHILVSTMPDPDEAFSDKIRFSIEKKLSKNHKNKEKTVLIIDNRTSAFEVSDYKASANDLESYLNDLPFREIWLYTGYCSDDDGNNAEFSFAPLKITPEQNDILSGMMSENDLDENGRILW